MPPNPFLDFLNDLEDPFGGRANFFSRINPMLPGQSQQYLGNQFGDFSNRFLGALGSQIRSGQTPTLTFTDFLQNNFNPRAELLKAPAYQTGQGISGLVSPARFLTSF